MKKVIAVTTIFRQYDPLMIGSVHSDDFEEILKTLNEKDLLTNDHLSSNTNTLRDSNSYVHFGAFIVWVESPQVFHIEPILVDH